jgi:hypothetical protein
MSDVVIQKLTQKQKDSIRWMYFGNYEITEISAKTSIDIDTIRFFVFGIDGTGADKTCLYQIKKNMSSTAISSFLADKASVLEQTCGVALAILNRSLMDLQKEVNTGKELSLDDMKKLSSIVTEMDKLVRLESGLATETIQHMGLSRAEAREILANDPFAQEAIEVEFKDTTLPWLEEKEK